MTPLQTSIDFPLADRDGRPSGVLPGADWDGRLERRVLRADREGRLTGALFPPMPHGKLGVRKIGAWKNAAPPTLQLGTAQWPDR